MENRIKAAFSEIHADRALINRTRELFAERARGYKRRAALRAAIPAVCAALLLFAGSALYFVPTARIDVEINPSLELGINIFDRVVSVTPLNDDGKALLETLDVRFAGYDEALDRIIGSESVSALLSENNAMTITVIETNTAQSEKLFYGAALCADGHRNVYCYSANADEAAQAHEAGLPCGKYRAFLELRELDPDVTPDDVRTMTMREIRQRIAELSGGNGNVELPDSDGNSDSDSISDNCGNSDGGGHHGNVHHNH